ncbi:arginyl-tRNA synthetase [Pyrenophora tritici-repentis Pt-1C-BFP]|uniref:Arginyl-tRNA synthetase n=1 Tax=Pyrenophora tritici-repentis (strain Pt-1C-BFP) TaxID=426418 RepID=B2VZN1_PYRTR|nr:arginyl-tRNA synthetase [Pyrenophora tritici-repentis Pt-1C-BFP]EDU45394.1 arginyl-tRNA synthetase [Pyrenophora tritici-repentis Pt-1C-BFP]
MNALEQSLGSLDLGVPIPQVEGAEVLANPLDIYRTYFGQILAIALDCDISIAYKSIQWPNNISNGDLAVILPKLRPGTKADAVAVELMEKGKHLRSTVIGAFIGRLYASMGWDVARVNYLGDWGKPIALLYVGWAKYGSEEAYDTDPIGHLLEVYRKIEEDFKPEQAASKQARDEMAKEGGDKGEAQVEIESRGIFAERNEAFKKLEEGDEGLVAFWKRVRDTNIANYAKFYDRLDIRFDEYSGESQISPDTMVEVEQMLKNKSLSEESGGAWIVHMQNIGAKAGTAIIRDRSGSSTYLLRDLAAALERSRRYSFDKMIYVVASDNSVHFTQLTMILEALDMKDLADRLQHVKFNEASKIVTALGRGYTPQGILDKCEEAMEGLQEADNDKLASMGDLLSNEDYEQLVEEEQHNLLRILMQYPEVMDTTFHSLEPSSIVAYLAIVTEQLAECLEEDDIPGVGNNHSFFALAATF